METGGALRGGAISERRACTDGAGVPPGTGLPREPGERTSMKTPCSLLLLLMLPALLLAAPKPTPHPAPYPTPAQMPIVFTHVTVIDGTGARPQPDRTVVIIGQQIVALGRTGRVPVPARAPVIDARGKFLIPGLWDMHVHISGFHVDKEQFLPMCLANSVTGVRDMGGNLSSAQIADRKRLYQKELELVGALRRARVPILAGTDVGNPYLFPGFSLHDELALLVEAGLTPMEALQASTRNPARFLGRNDLGTVEKGKVADLVLLDADPLVEIRNTTRIAAVVVGGRLLPKAVLEAMLAGVEAAASTS
jgi:imidazolonepropionase-like amidohydrolase